jgi:hypothetical protein
LFQIGIKGKIKMADLICMFCGRPVEVFNKTLIADVGGSICQKAPNKKHILIADGVHCVFCGDERDIKAPGFYFKNSGTLCVQSPTKKHLLAYFPEQTMKQDTEINIISEEKQIESERNIKKPVQNIKTEKLEITDEEYRKVEARLDYYERQRSIENKMIQDYLIKHKSKGIIEQIIAKDKKSLLLKIIVSIVMFVSLYVIFAVLENAIICAVLIAVWIILFKIISNRTLTAKRRIASSEMPNGKIDFIDAVCEKVSIWDHKILGYISTSEGKEWLKTKYNN